MKKLLCVILVLCAGACSPREETRPAPPPPPGPPMGDRRIEFERRRARELAAEVAELNRREARFLAKLSFETMPIADVVGSATEDEIAGWIRDLGETRGDAPRRAERRLSEQGVRIADRLREVSREDSLRGAKAQGLLETLEPEFRFAWTLEARRDFAMLADGWHLLTWVEEGEFPPYALALFDMRRGRVIWEIGTKQMQDVDGRSFGWGNALSPPKFDPSTGRWSVARNSREVLQVDPATSVLTVSTSISPDRKKFDGETLERPTHEVAFQGGSAIAWGTSSLWFVPSDSPGFRLTVGGNKRLLDVKADSVRILALTDDGLNSYNPGTLKLEAVRPIPRGATWLGLSGHSGRAVLGGKGWTNLVALEGGPPEILGRAEGQFDPMTAMGGDDEGRWVFTGDDQGFLRVFLLETLERVATVAVGRPFNRIEYLPQERLLLAIEEVPEEQRWRTDGACRIHAFRLVDPSSPK